MNQTFTAFRVPQKVHLSLGHERILPFWGYTHCWAANSFPIMGAGARVWITGSDKWSEIEMWCREGGGGEWSLITCDGPRCAPPPPAFLTAQARSAWLLWNCEVFWKMLCILRWPSMMEHFFCPLINLLILVYWNAVFTNGKVLLLHNHFNPSLSQKTFMMGNFQIS